MHEKEEKGGKMLPQGGGSGGCRIGSSVAAQSRYCGFSWNSPFMTSFLFTLLYSLIWIGSCKILTWNFSQLYDQS